MKRYILRLDDASEYMDVPKWKRMSNLLIFRFFTLFCGIKIITYKIGIEKEHYLLQNVSCLKLRTEVE